MGGARSIGAAFAQIPPNYTALWWNPTESGWGLNINHQGELVFATLFTYDTSGAPLWLVMSAGARQGTTGTFFGDLYRTTGSAFNAIPFVPLAAENVTRVGTMTISFSTENAAQLQYSLNGGAVTKAIERQIFGARAAKCRPTTSSRASATNYQDLWWNASESGWGLNITHQGEMLFATLFTYGSNGSAVWFVLPSGPRQFDGSYAGDLYQTFGPVFNAQPWTGIGFAVVGTMRLRFQHGESGTLEYTVNGIGVTKSITRQVFSSPQPSCS